MKQPFVTNAAIDCIERIIAVVPACGIRCDGRWSWFITPDHVIGSTLPSIAAALSTRSPKTGHFG